MAKESMKAREVKRAKLVARYAEKRAALKQIVRTGEPADAFEAAQKLQELPKNSNPIRMHLSLIHIYVNTVKYAGKNKSRYTKAGIINGRTNAFKKAIVTLKEGDTIDFYSNI